MPTNLSHKCTELEKKYLAARTLLERIAAIEELHASIPKHKGTERLRKQLKTKLAKMRMELEEKRERGRAGSSSGKFAIRKEGAAQVVILGAAGSGKSSLLGILTKARPRILGQPFTTSELVPGMMSFEDTQIQLVEAPAIFEGQTWARGGATGF